MGHREFVARVEPGTFRKLKHVTHNVRAGFFRDLKTLSACFRSNYLVKSEPAKFGKQFFTCCTLRGANTSLAACFCSLIKMLGSFRQHWPHTEQQYSR